MKTLILDGNNLIHRARSGYKKGDHPIVYNLFRGLRPLIERFEPNRYFFVLEGVPKANIDLLPEYKANRKPLPDGFVRQREEIIGLLSETFPIYVALHPDYEADDTISHLAMMEDHNEVTIVSNDSDFIQLLQRKNPPRLWNWKKKEFEVAPPYDYVKWKALRGDGSDNIPGIPGVGDKTATRLLEDANLFKERVCDAGFWKLYERNLEVIRLTSFFTDGGPNFSPAVADWDRVEEAFESWGFMSMLKEKTWEKYKETFSCLMKVRYD